LSDYSYYNPLGEISKHLMDSLKIGTLSAEIASFSGFVPIKEGQLNLAD